MKKIVVIIALALAIVAPVVSMQSQKQYRFTRDFQGNVVGVKPIYRTKTVEFKFLDNSYKTIATLSTNVAGAFSPIFATIVSSREILASSIGNPSPNAVKKLVELMKATYTSKYKNSRFEQDTKQFIANYIAREGIANDATVYLDMLMVINSLKMPLLAEGAIAPLAEFLAKTINNTPSQEFISNFFGEKVDSKFKTLIDALKNNAMAKDQDNTVMNVIQNTIYVNEDQYGSFLRAVSPNGKHAVKTTANQIELWDFSMYSTDDPDNPKTQPRNMVLQIMQEGKLALKETISHGTKTIITAQEAEPGDVFGQALFSPNNKYLAYTIQHGYVNPATTLMIYGLTDIYYNLNNATLIHSMKFDNSRVTAFAFDKHSSRLAIATDNEKTYILNFISNTMDEIPQSSSTAVTFVGDYLARADNQGAIHIYNTKENYKLVKTIKQVETLFRFSKAPQHMVYELTATPDGKYLIEKAGSHLEQTYLRCIDTTTWEVVKVFDVTPHSSIAVSPDSTTLAYTMPTSRHKNTIYLVDIATWKANSKNLFADQDFIEHVYFKDNSKELLVLKNNYISSVQLGLDYYTPQQKLLIALFNELKKINAVQKGLSNKAISAYLNNGYNTLLRSHIYQTYLPLSSGWFGKIKGIFGY